MIYVVAIQEEQLVSRTYIDFSLSCHWKFPDEYLARSFYDCLVSMFCLSFYRVSTFSVILGFVDSDDLTDESVKPYIVSFTRFTPCDYYPHESEKA